MAEPLSVDLRTRVLITIAAWASSGGADRRFGASAESLDRAVWSAVRIMTAPMNAEVFEAYPGEKELNGSIPAA
jgi:hypothetical protein